MRIAKSIIEGEEIKHVLIVCYDWTTFSSKTPQVMESNSSFLSDAVISCIVSNKNTPSVNNTGTYKVVDFETSSNHTLYDKRIVNYVQGIKISADSIKKVSKTLFLRNNLNSTDFKCFIAGNFNTMLKKNYAFISGFKKEQVYENDSLMGHSFSTDQLIALKNICTDVSGVEHGEYLYVLWSGDYFWGGLILRKV